MLHTFTAQKLNLDGSLNTIDQLGHFEVDEWMQWAYGRFATVRITRDDGKAIIYTDNGDSWEVSQRIK